MKYFLLFKNTNNKTCSLENRNSYIFRKQYYNNELFNTAESIEISFSKDAANKFLPLKNIIVIHGLNDSFVVDEYTMELLQSHFSDCLSFIKTEVINDDEYKNLKFYILYSDIIHSPYFSKASLKIQPSILFSSTNALNVSLANVSIL